MEHFVNNNSNVTQKTTTTTTSCRPFDKYSFFLDPKNSTQINATLSEKIIQLGGKIDIFINKNTSIVVTSRPKTVRTTITGIDQQSPTPKLALNSNNAFSRGKLLLEKTTTSAFSQASDPLELARTFNIRIIRSSKLLQFCEDHIENVRKLKHSTASQLNTTRKLCPPFIKIIDNSNKYRPNFKELNEWPEMNFEYQPESCPFFKAKPLVNISQQPHPNQSQQSNKSTVPTIYKQLNEKCTMLTTPILTGTNTNTPNIMNGKSITTNTITNNKAVDNRKKKNVTYCEICHKDYTDFESHLNYQKHAEFLNNSENFNELIGVINSLPPFAKESWIKNRTTIVNDSDTSLTDLTNKQTSVNNSIAVDEIPKAKTPSPSITTLHSINAATWSSASKNRSFVAIHDLLNRQPNENENVTHSDNIVNQNDEI
uniref:Protein DBF4 homolog A-like isoform X1 n=1 Tax=Dermatophagoides pteronyssinus TaxID=6956 RepID=A0A6P6XZ09_DERPT|nr:protein DBF4 homolog A-like isoform X1 [Dermatophagoides pteronyssinus]